VLPLLVVANDPAMIRPCAASVMLTAFKVT
jgi:hypothetical protein